MNNPSAILDQMIADPTINGQPVDVDNAFGGECWDLVELFAERCGVPKEPWAVPLGPRGHAEEAWTYFDKSPHMQKYFDKVPAGQQRKGDIGVYAGRPGYEEGHILIFINSNNAVFEENADPDGSPAHVYTNRSATYLLGVLRLKKEDDMGATPDMNGGDMVNVWNTFDGHPPTKADTDHWLTDEKANWKTLVYDKLLVQHEALKKQLADTQKQSAYTPVTEQLFKKN